MPTRVSTAMPCAFGSDRCNTRESLNLQLVRLGDRYKRSRNGPSVLVTLRGGTWARNNPNGSATMTFTVSDTDEVIRWSLGFGADAKVIGPAGAVERAKALLSEIVESYKISDEA